MAVRPPVGYPGVYVEEEPDRDESIPGVPTSIAAFLGRTSRGPVNGPVLILGYADFERVFGDLHEDMTLAYAVRDFFLNGGEQAYVVRLFKDEQDSDTARGVLPGSPLTLEAAHPGDWGNRITVEVTHPAADAKVPHGLAARGLTADDLFDLAVTSENRKGRKSRERIRSASLHEDARHNRVDLLLEQRSTLVRCPGIEDDSGARITTRPADGASLTLSGGCDSDPLGEDLAGLMDADAHAATKIGLGALDDVDVFNLLVVPPDTRTGRIAPATYQQMMRYCEQRRAVCLIDPEPGLVQAAERGDLGAEGRAFIDSLMNDAAANGAVYFPRVMAPDPLRAGKVSVFPAGGMIAGVIARTDATRGVWKAPAGVEAVLEGVAELELKLDDGLNGVLNSLGINAMRDFGVTGKVVWGARTLRGADELGDEWRYLPVRRLALFLEESLFRGTKWVVFEPNDENLWARLRLSIAGFLTGLFRQGAFQGQTQHEAFFVRCDATTTTPDDIASGLVNVLVGFAPVKPAEFVILHLQQKAGGAS